MASEPCLPLAAGTRSRAPRKRARLAAAFLTAAVFLCAGCASLGAGRPDAETVLGALFPPGEGAGTLRGEAEVTISMAGRSVSMPGAILLGNSGAFRIDLLDPLDRPVVIIFSEGERIVQYRPAAAEAAALDPLPGACRSVLPGGWVPFVLGSAPSGADEAPFEAVSWFGGDSLVKYEWGTISVKIDYLHDDDGSVPSRVGWYCADEVAMRLEYGAGSAGRGSVPGRFTVEYPRARLKVEVRLGEHETGSPLPEALFHPRLPARTRWIGWDLAGEGQGGVE